MRHTRRVLLREGCVPSSRPCGYVPQARYMTVTCPARDPARDPSHAWVTAAVGRRLLKRWETRVTWPLHDRYRRLLKRWETRVTWPLHDRYMTVTWPLHDRYMTVTGGCSSAGRRASAWTTVRCSSTAVRAAGAEPRRFHALTPRHALVTTRNRS